MDEKPKRGDRDALAMAVPFSEARDFAQSLAGRIGGGPVLELCAGAGGLTRALAQGGRRVTAVDRSRERLGDLMANLFPGTEELVSPVCLDLSRPGLLARSEAVPFALAVLDPDWSPPGRPPGEWAARLEDMEPPAPALVELARGLAVRVVIRLPPLLTPGELDGLGPENRNR